jgi:hypothetical protein
MLSPSAIQRADDLVGIEMPMLPLSCAQVDGKTPNAAKVRLAATARKNVRFMKWVPLNARR